MSAVGGIEFRLTSAERASPLWLRLREHLDLKLQQKRARNDDHTLTEQQTAVMRGHIQCLKEIILLEKMPPVIDGDQSRTRGDL